MSSIDALEIVGVRAFGSHTQRIRIGKPLTLIVGHNGSGKTTIIECLKYATTGVMPPTTTQAGFLHDPNLKGDRETLAKVLVVISTAARATLTCVRRMSVTLQKGSLSFKTLESSAKVQRDGEDVSDSVLRGELDAQIPAWLGVSRAVLDRVIFCHQDDSLWPLDTAKKVKDHFDILFEAQKYAKAIEQIKVLRKKQTDNLKLFKLEVNHQRQNKEEGARIQAKCESLHNEVEQLRAESTELTTSIREVAEKAEEAFTRANRAGEIVGRLEGKRIEARAKQENIDSIRQTLKELEDSDEVLQDLVEQYDERTKAYKGDLSTQRRLADEVQHHITTTRTSVGAKERECGSYEASYDNHQLQIGTRKTLIKETAHRHGVRGFDGDIDDEQVKTFVDRITKMARDQAAAFEQLRRQAHEELQVKQKALNEINQRKTGLTTRKDNARQQIALNDRKIDSLRQELDKISVDEGDKAALQSNLESTTARLSTAKANVIGADFIQQISETEDNLRRSEEQKQKIEDELVDATRSASDSAQLEYTQKELKDRQQRLHTISGAHKERLSAVVGGDWQPSTLAAAYQAAQEQAASSLSEAEKQRDGCSRELQQIDYKLAKCTSDLKESTAAVATAASLIDKVVEGGPKEYQNELRQLEESRDIIKADADSFKMMLEYLDQCIKDAERHKVCRTCTRALHKDRDIDALKRNIEKQRQNFQLGQASSDLHSVEKQLDDVKAVAGQYETWERLSHTEIPALKKQVELLNQERAAIITRLETHDVEVNDRATSKRDVEAVAKTVTSIVRYHIDIGELEVNITDLSARLQSAGMSRGLEVIKADNARIKEEERVLRASLTNARVEKEKADKEINMLEISIRDIQNSLSKADFQLREKLSTRNQIDELKASNVEQRQSVDSVDRSLQQLADELAEAQARYDDTAAQGGERVREMQADTDRLNNSCNQLSLISREIQAYIDRDGPAQLQRAREVLQQLKAQASELEAEQVKIEQDVKALEKLLGDHDNTRVSIVNNLRFRRDLRALESVRAEIQELETHDAVAEKEQYTHEGEVWQLQHTELTAKKAHVHGLCTSKDTQLAELIDKYENQYKDAAEKFRKAQIDVATTDACQLDLGKYSDALDKAIMKFHSIKMEEINRIIDELWRKTYQGTDVDTIYIRSDSEGKGNKAYNYRVCMLKQQTEMDMRGRCSAGQKVLACIIIRLALAECFGINCGLIALDEPTTNLDRDNIQALAMSLAELINVRRAQKNFQLIVITHDEDFLKCMHPSNYVDNYYRVGRDINQESYIKRESINTLMR